MNLRRVAVMYLKDLREAVRDGRILVAVLLPVGLAIYYSVALPDPTARPDATLYVVGPTDAQVVQDVRTEVRETVRLTVETADSERAARASVRDDGSSSSLALVLPDDVDAAMARGDAPRVELFVPRDPDVAESIVAQAVAGASTRGAEPPPATVELHVEEIDTGSGSPFEQLGLELGLGIFSMVMLASFIALLVVPVLLMEEAVQRTLEALQLVATTVEIILAKLLVGLTYCAIAIALTIPAAQMDLVQPALFVAAALVVSVTLSGFGLAFGLLLGDPGRVNTWSGVLLLPLIVPVVVALEEPGRWTQLAQLVPTGAGAVLLAKAADPSVIEVGLLPVVSLVAWTAAGFGTLWWLLERRDA